MPSDALNMRLLNTHAQVDRRDLATVLGDVLSTTMRSVSAEGGFILVLDDGGWPSHWYVLQDGKQEFISPARARPVLEHGVVNWVIQQRQGALVDDVANDARWSSLSERTGGAVRGSALCLPLLAYDRVVGVLALVHQTPGFFAPQHFDMLQGVVDQAALAVDNARLYEMLQRQAEELAIVYELALNISADQSLDQLLDTIVVQAMDLLGCQGGGLFLWHADEARLELLAAYDPEIDLRGKRVASGEGLAGKVLETGDPLIADECADWGQHVSGIPDNRLLSGLPFSAAIAVPLVWQGRRLGVLMGTDRRPDRHFGPHDQHLLTLLAEQAAAAIASVQLSEQNSRRLEELTFLNQTIRDITVTLDLDEIFAILTRRVKDLLGIEACSIALVDRETNELVFRAASGGGAEAVLGERVPWGRGIVGVAAQSGQPVNVSDVGQNQSFYQELDRKQDGFVTHSILAVPMISRGQVVGVLEGLNKPGGFHAEDERLLSALARLAASVVENANLVSSERDLEELRDNLIHMIVHDLRSPVGTISNSLQLLSRLLESGAPDQAGQLIDIASRAARRLVNLVDSLLDMHRLESGQELADQQPASIKALIQSALDQLAFDAKRKRIRTQVQWPDQLPVVMADGAMIERVLVNLIHNALKFTPVDGQVDIAAEVGEDLLYVHVSDQGPGITPEYHGAIFEKFGRLRVPEGVRGIGLGLAFCRLAIEAHGGRIWVESSSERGSTFTFTLPVPRLRDRAAGSAGV